MLAVSEVCSHVFHSTPLCDMSLLSVCIEMAGSTRKELGQSLFLKAIEKEELDVIERLVMKVSTKCYWRGVHDAIRKDKLDVVQLILTKRQVQEATPGEALRTALFGKGIDQANLRMVRLIVEEGRQEEYDVTLVEDDLYLPYVPVPVLRYLVSRGLSRYAVRRARYPIHPIAEWMQN
jgi:hypothetical protein